ncbi:class IV adenylate cyclase [Amycolatopsis sp. NPDC051716]|uniref:class IV adenylate cyclase n=1 Tax=Amycolatopsis sp. NPDC051716 TaxID=3155804 RepID=UPI0034408FEF
MPGIPYEDPAGTMTLAPEYEARFVHVDVERVAVQLAACGAKQVSARTLMTRVIFENPHIAGKRGWLRLRQEGETTMLTYKQATGASSTVDSVLEVQTPVGDFAATYSLLEAVGFTPVRHQESYREQWVLDGVTLDFDEWPDLPPFLEVEGPDEEAVQLVAKRLGLSFDEAKFGSVDELYLSELGRDILQEARLTFQGSVRPS